LEFSKNLGKFKAQSSDEILARYRNLFPELISTDSEVDVRTEVHKFMEKLKVNIEFFSVGLSEIKINSRKCQEQETL